MGQKLEMDTQSRIDFVCRLYDAMTRRVRQVSECGSTRLSIEFLKANDIHVSRLCWRPEGKIDLEPQFCDPYPAADFEALFAQTKAVNYLGSPEYTKWDSDSYENCEDTESARRIGRSHAASSYLGCLMGQPHGPGEIAAEGDWLSCIGRRQYKSRSSALEIGSPSVWRFDSFLRSLPWPQDDLPTNSITLKKLEEKLRWTSLADWPIAVRADLRRPGKRSSVHMAVVTFDDSEICEESVLRSEMIAAISVMRDQMRQRPSMEQHVIYPVFVYSWSGFHVRVLQVHFDFPTNQLVVRKTSYIEIDGPKRQDEIKLMLRWMMNKPKGDTRWEDLISDNAVVAAVQKSTNESWSPKKQRVQYH